MVDSVRYVNKMLWYAGEYHNDLKTWDRVWCWQESTLVFDFKVLGHRFGLDVAAKGDGLHYSVLGRTDEARKILRNSLIGKHPMMKFNGERHLLRVGTITTMNEARESVRVSADLIASVSDSVRLTVTATDRGADVPQGALNLFWWDDRPNFGDAVGPWLVKTITGLQPVNGRGTSLDEPPLATVGSIIGMLTHDRSTVWGSGLMGRLGTDVTNRLKKLQDITVLAVRGRLTRNELIEKLEWNVPEIYGDPALLLPRYLPKADGMPSAGKTVVVPHYHHMQYFAGISDDNLHLVDVERGMERVVQEIASANACVSTSLHGIIIAQAYGIPWTWLRVDDHKLGGDSFKFEDFFSTLDRGAVHAVSVGKEELPYLELKSLAKQSTLPQLTISLEPLMDCFRTHVRRVRPSSLFPPDMALSLTEGYCVGGDAGDLLTPALTS